MGKEMKKIEIARYAYENVPFYKGIVNGEIESWDDYPIVDKKMICQNMDAVFSPEYMMDYLSERLEHVMTSGSTGDCLDVFWKREQNVKSLLPLWAKRKRYYGVLPNHRRCYFFTTKIVDGIELDIERTKYGLGFNKMDLSESKILEMYDMMLDFNPEWMIAQPSIMMLFVNVLKKHNRQRLPELRYIEVTGERVTSTMKDVIAEFFECNVASQYGCYEVNSIAYECPHGRMHVMSENVFLESVGEGDLCVTSLHNKVMPFIRYKVGDKGKIINKTRCLCGNNEPIVELEMARENDWIYNADGTRCHSDLFCNVIQKINIVLQQAIKQYQIVQKDYNEFDVYLVIDEEDEKILIKNMFVEYYEIYQERSKFNFFFVDYLYPSEKTGKLAWYISKVKGGDWS